MIASSPGNYQAKQQDQKIFKHAFKLLLKNIVSSLLNITVKLLFLFIARFIIMLTAYAMIKY